VSVADREVDMSILQRVSLDIGSDWRSLGRQLHLSDGDLDAVQFDFRDSGQRETAYQMLRCWHEQFGRDARLDVLARALVDIKRPHIALKLQAAASQQ